MSNTDVARAMTSIESYDRMIKVYEKRPLSEQHRTWLETLVRQRDLKLKEAR
jgi:hypothetical protein